MAIEERNDDIEYLKNNLGSIFGTSSSQEQNTINTNRTIPRTPAIEPVLGAEDNREWNLRQLREMQEQKEKQRGLEFAEGHHPIQDFNNVLENLDKVTAEQISQQLDYFNGKPVIINGIAHHPFNDPMVAARLNARYKQLTGEDHPVYMEQELRVIDEYIKDESKLIQAGAYTPMYFDRLHQIKDSLVETEELKEEKPIYSEEEKQEINTQLEKAKAELREKLEWAEKQPNEPQFSSTRSDNIEPLPEWTKDEGISGYTEPTIEQVREGLNRGLQQQSNEEVADKMVEMMEQGIDVLNEGNYDNTNNMQKGFTMFELLGIISFITSIFIASIGVFILFR